MPTAEETLYTALSTTTSITDILSTRIYPLQAPDTAQLPYAVYQRVSTVTTNTLAGDAGLDFVNMQISVWSDDHAEAHSAITAIRNKLNTLGYLTTNLADDYDPEYTQDGVSGAYGKRIEVQIV